MKTLMAVGVAIFLFDTALMPAEKKQVAGKKLYIDKMPQDLDSYLKAEIVKQKVPLVVVSLADEADYIMGGTSTEEERRKWHEGWLTAERDKTSGSTEIIDSKTKTLLWAGEAGDRSFWWGAMARGGHRKVASRLIKHLKPYIGK